MSGRHQGWVSKPSHAKSRDGRVDFARGEPSLRCRSPHHHTVEGIRRNRKRDIPSDPLERREYERHIRCGQGERREYDSHTRCCRDEQVHSRPDQLVGRSDKRTHINKRVVHMSPPAVGAHRGYDYAEYEYCDDEPIRKSKHVYDYDDHIQISEQDYDVKRFLVDNEHGAVINNLMPEEDVLDPQLVRLHQDHGHGQGYGQSSQSYSTMEMRRSMEGNDPQLVRLHQNRGHGQGYGQSSRSYSTMEMRKSMEGNDYQEVISPQKVYVEKYYKDKEKYVHESRKSPRPLSSKPEFKDFGNQHLSRGTPGTSSGVIRNESPVGFQNVDINPFDGYQRKPEKVSEALGTKEYGQRPHFEYTKYYQVGYADKEPHLYNAYGYTWNEHEDYTYVNDESRGKHDPDYISHDVLYREGHVHSRADSEHRYIERPTIAKHHGESPIGAEGSQRRYSDDNGWREFDVGQKEVRGYVDLRRAFDTSKQEGDYLDSGYASDEFGRRASQEIELNEALHEHEISAYDYGRYVSVARSHRDRVRSSCELVEPADTRRLVGRADRYADEQIAYNKSAKRKYLHDEESSGFSLGTTVSNKWNTCSGSRQMEDCRPEWIGLHSKVPSGREPNLFLEAKDMMDEINRHNDSTQYGLSDQGKWVKMKESIKSSGPGRKYPRVHANSEYSKRYGQSHYVFHRSDHYKQHYVGKKSEHDVPVDVVPQDGNLSEDPKGIIIYDPYEDTEGFKKSVQAAFFMYSKKLNENPPIRKLYKDQGKSGTLFCIVCGRSVSKVFRDTEGLAKHGLMCRKARLRAEHLGLSKAICVLMGWSSESPCDIFTWMPQALPQPEAMAQKEDLILWQPIVIVHNISLSNTNHNEWKVISLEALEDIVRVKGFIRSKIKVCLGYPGDQSVMLVKFLGTFTGLQEAEKLHKYFAEKKRGRAYFEEAISNMSKGNDSVQMSAQEEVEEESLLYGYLGIAEDLDRVDFDTKKICKIKSKKEIQDIADAPLKAD